MPEVSSFAMKPTIAPDEDTIVNSGIGQAVAETELAEAELESLAGGLGGGGWYTNHNQGGVSDRDVSLDLSIEQSAVPPSPEDELVETELESLAGSR
jgi:hypothetical protein